MDKATAKADASLGGGGGVYQGVIFQGEIFKIDIYQSRSLINYRIRKQLTTLKRRFVVCYHS